MAGLGFSGFFFSYTTLVYNRNQYFGPIPKPKPKLAIFLANTVTDTETTFERQNLVHSDAFFRSQRDINRHDS